jgi:predicted anti-sigma-YlaC factor YlaD
MKHEKIKKLVSEYIDGELKKNIELVEEHLKSCDECSQLVRAS